MSNESRLQYTSRLAALLNEVQWVVTDMDGEGPCCFWCSEEPCRQDGRGCKRRVDGKHPRDNHGQHAQGCRAAELMGWERKS